MSNHFPCKTSVEPRDGALLRIPQTTLSSSREPHPTHHQVIFLGNLFKIRIITFSKRAFSWCIYVNVRVKDIYCLLMLKVVKQIIFKATRLGPKAQQLKKDISQRTKEKQKQTSSKIKTQFFPDPPIATFPPQSATKCGRSKVIFPTYESNCLMIQRKTINP